MNTEPFPNSRLWEGKEDFSPLNFSMECAQVTCSSKSYSHHEMVEDGASIAPQQPIAGIAWPCGELAPPAPAPAAGILPCTPPHSVCFVYRLIFSIQCIQKKYSPAGLKSPLNIDTPGLQTSPTPAETCSQGSALPTTPRDPTAGDGVFLLPVPPNAGSSEWLDTGKKGSCFVHVQAHG